MLCSLKAIAAPTLTFTASKHRGTGNTPAT